MSELSFRDATAADIAAILSLIDGGAPPGVQQFSDPNDPAYRGAFEAITASPEHRLLVFESGGEIVGTLQISFLPGLARRGALRGQIESVHVRADNRGQGIGANMMAVAIRICRERGCGMVQLTSNSARTDAHRFYRKLGFAQSHDGFKLML